MQFASSCSSIYLVVAYLKCYNEVIETQDELK